MARLLVFDGFVFISALVFFGYLLGLNKFLSKHGDNGCEMTYMYEYPQFVRVTLAQNVTAEYRRYGLYVYSEGRHTQQTRNMQFSGIPVLFIPGQGGSFKQVRSLASVALRKALGSDAPFHFDFFTLDLNEEYSAMFGGVLTAQTRFTVHAAQRILSLYRRVRPDSLVLIGHSMGGMIAKSLFLEPDFPSHAVRLVLTLATPHAPVVLPDPLLQDFYLRLSPHTLSDNITVISLGGGVKDLVVRAGLTLTEKADISAVTTAVSEVWMSVDHLCILWCKQLVLVLVRALFDSVDSHTLQISRDPELRLSVFKYHLLERSAGKRYHESQHPLETTFQLRSEWLELSRPRHSVYRQSLSTPLHLLVHLPTITASEGTPDTLAVATSGHKARDWLFACPQISTVDGRRICVAGENLSGLGRITPSRHRKHKVALVSLTDLRARGLHYLVIRLPPSDEPTSVSYDMFYSRDRAVSVSLPRWLLPLQWSTLVTETVLDANFYSLDLPQLERPWQAYHLRLDVLKCANATHQAVATLKVPWSHQHSSVILRNSAELVLPILLHTARPTDWSGPAPYVTLHLDPKCQYSVHIQSSAVESLAQLVRLYSGQLIAYVAAILLLTLRQQLISLSSQQHCLLFHHALLKGAKPYYILPAVKIASTLLRSVEVLPVPDSSSHDFLLLPLFLYSVAFSITFLLGLFAYAAVICSGSTVNKFALKFVGKLAGVSRTWTDWLMAAVEKVPCVVSAGMVAILLSSCGGLTMIIGFIYYFMRVCGMYEDYIEQLFFAPVKYLKDTVIATWKGRQMPVVDDVIREAEDLLSLKGLTEFNFHLSLLMLWGTATVVHIPSVLVWAHNFKYSPVLEPDPSSVVALVSSVCAAILWTLNTPQCHEEGEMYRRMSDVMFVLACLVLGYCSVSLYNLPVLIAGAFVCLTLQQVYEWVCERWNRDIRASDSPSEEESEDDKAETKPAIEAPDSEEEESSLGDSDQSDRVTPDKSENVSRKNSRTSEISMSSFEAVSLTELKDKEKQAVEQTVETEHQGEDESEEEIDDEEEEEEREEPEHDEREEPEPEERKETEPEVIEDVKTKEEPKEQIKKKEYTKKELKLKRKQRGENDEDEDD